MIDLSNSTPAPDPSIADFLSAFNVPTTGVALTGDNSGSTLDYSQGVTGGQQPQNTVGNSLLDSISQLSAFATSTITAGLGAYSSFLNQQAIANAANRLGTTPTAVTGAISTVPMTAAQQQQKLFLYLGIAAVAAVVLFKVVKK